MTVKEKIMKVLEFKGIAKEKFFEKIGMTSANFRGNAANTPLNSDAIANIFREIPDLNLEWLLTGTGPMLKDINTPTQTLELEVLRLYREKDDLQKENEKLQSEIRRLRAEEFQYKEMLKTAIPTPQKETEPPKSHKSAGSRSVPG